MLRGPRSAGGGNSSSRAQASDHQHLEVIRGQHLATVEIAGLSLLTLAIAGGTTLVLVLNAGGAPAITTLNRE